MGSSGVCSGICFPAGSLVLTPGGPQGPEEHPLVLAWTRAEQKPSFKEPSPALPTADSLSSSLLPLLLSLSQGVIEAGTEDHQPGPQPAVVSRFPQLCCAGRTFQGHQAVPNHRPTHHGDQSSSEGAGHSSHILRRLPSHGSNHGAQAGPFICRGHAPCPQESSLIPHMPPIPGWNPHLPQPPPLH